MSATVSDLQHVILIVGHEFWVLKLHLYFGNTVVMAEERVGVVHSFNTVPLKLEPNVLIIIVSLQLSKGRLEIQGDHSKRVHLHSKQSCVTANIQTS